ncbi:MAG: choice-of-anchor Q domain-containing protein, partial [Planctomycetota bacterium]
MDRRSPIWRRSPSLERLESRRLLASIVVNTTADIVDSEDAFVSLREAISQANSTPNEADIITFDPSLDGKTIRMTRTGSPEDQNDRGDLDLTSGQVILRGNGTSQTIISAGGDSGIGERVFHLLGTAQVTIEDLTITGGRTANGAGILNESGESVFLTLSGVRMIDNNASFAGGALQVGSGSVSEVFGSTFANNSGALGGAIASFGKLTVTSSAIDNNSAVSGGGIYVESSTSQVTVISSTISNHTGARVGGAIANFGNFTLLNSTLSGNAVTSAGGAIYNSSSGISPTASTTVRQSTITNNSSPDTGVLHSQSESIANASTLTLEASIVVGNSGLSGGGSDNVTFASEQGSGGAVVTSLGNNLFDDNAFGIGIASDETSVSAPVLVPTLSHNGGPVRTHALTSQSPAIDAFVGVAGATDTRGVLRDPNRTDIGAIEVDTPVVTAGISGRARSEGGLDTFVISATATAYDTSDLIAAGPLHLDVSVSGDAITPADFNLSGNQINIFTTSATTSSVSGSVTLSVLDDNTVEATQEEATVSVSNLSGKAIFSSATLPTIRFNDNDAAELTIADAVGSESAGMLDFELRLSRPVDAPVDVTVRTREGSAKAGTDFVPLDSRTVRFQPGQTSRSVTVTVSPNLVIDGDRQFELEIIGIDSPDRVVSGPVVTLDRPQVIGGDVNEFDLTPDGHTTIYLAD